MSETRSDREAERHLLAACLTSKPARDEARRHLLPGDFDDPRHETIWKAMGTLDRAKAKVDPMTVHAALGTSQAVEVMPDLVTLWAPAENVAEYARIVRGWAVRRNLHVASIKAQQDALNPNVNPGTLAADIAGRFIGIRDGGPLAEDVTGLTVAELLAQADDQPDWLVPGYLERRDRLMLTGEEGLGKSHLLRQFAVCSAAGLSPFSTDQIDPLRTLVIDCENTWNQVRRKVRPAADYARQHGQEDPADRMMVDCTNRMDITRDRDLARIHQLLDAWQPDLVVIGPLYRLVPRALQTDDDTAPVLAALDTIRDRGAAVLIEAHAGHAIGKGGVRDLRPRGSSSLLGWPEFGYGMRNIGTEGFADLVPWRGNREERDWPQRLRRGDGYRWVPHRDLYGWNEGGAA